jgi:Flp pilus assembly protein TadG
MESMRTLGLHARLRPWLHYAHDGGWRRHLASFRSEERGVVAVIFAIVFCAVLLAVAAAIDYARTAREYARVQNALDAAALAASHRLGTPDQDTLGRADADAYFSANTARQKAVGTLESVALDADNGQVNATAKGNMWASLMRAVGIRQIGFNNQTTVKRGSGTIEIALVLDNSSGLAGQPIVDLRTAAKSLANLVFAGAQDSNNVKVGVIPFAGAVNVGADKRAAWWIDSAGLASYHAENFSQSVSRFALFDRLGTSWAGCVEARPSPYDVDDTPPNTAVPNSLFVPIFAPDEPDPANAGNDAFVNDYLADSGGSCPQPATQCLNYNSNSKCTKWATTPIPPLTAQTQICKYDGAVPLVAALGPTRSGPNMNCDSTPLTPLTTVRSDVIAALDAMSATGGANISEGIAWGWRVLAPNAPFGHGRPYDVPGNKKYLILMARGANWIVGQKNMNESYYSAWGFGANNRLNSSSHTTPSLTDSMNQKARAACRGASDKGVQVYTIAFGVSDAHTRSMLKYCATDPSMTYTAETADELKTIFETIARNITPVRISG